ncbi:MAG: 50S ribosomal protein L32 [Clostridia bacterium]|nr:50S ribosomal protein L32 [Clostridia bacterium]
MAVQKSKVSKARTNTRFSNNSKLTAPSLVECPQCHELKVAHKVCAKCGYYDGKQVVDTSAKEKKD